ncbi:MAG: hypothetical protein R6V74_11550 [Lutibacter sp.]
MKNQFTSRIVKFTFAFMFIVLASSCSEDNDAMDAAVLAQENNEIAAKGAKVSAAAAVEGSFNLPSQVCAGEPADFCFTAPIGTNLQVQQLIAGEWEQVYQSSQSTLANPCFPLTFATAGDYQLRYKIGSGGFSAPVTVTVINCGCDESFNYAANGGGSYTFTYIPAEDLENANLVFTFAQGVTVTGLTDWSSNGVTMQKTMNLEACTTYTWTVTLTPNCSGNSNNSNVWTDFKVVNNDGDLLNDSKKNNKTPNIVISCN